MGTAATVTGIRQDIQARLDTVPSLTGRTYAYMVDSVNPPCAMVLWPDTLEYDATFQRGLDNYVFVIRLLVNRTAERSGQEALDAYIAGSGPQSVKVAVEAGNAPLPSTGQPVRVSKMRGYGAYTLGALGGDTMLLGAELLVETMA